MLKNIIKTIVMALVFVTTIYVGVRIMNQDSEAVTMEMKGASFPMVSLSWDGIEYNQLHGYAQKQQVQYFRDSLTFMTENRHIDFKVDTYGRTVTNIEIQVRTVDGKRLIENSEVVGARQERDLVEGTIALKDLIDTKTRYSLEIILTLDKNEKAYYYTQVFYGADYYLTEKLEFILDFHNKLFDKEASRELKRYLETNRKLNDNSTLNYVNIYSTLKQVSYADLDPKQVGDCVVTLKEIDQATCQVILEYFLATGEESAPVYYRAKEYFRIRYTPERVYLLGYERWMNQIPSAENMAIGDKLILGITDENVYMKENGDGSTLAFVADGALFAYNQGANKLTSCFDFRNSDIFDSRTNYNAHEIIILDVTDSGDVDFAVYGYMNRGRHEGEIGIEIYHYDTAYNTIRELAYIPYEKSYQLLCAELGDLMYLNDLNHLHLSIGEQIYRIDLESGESAILDAYLSEETTQVSDSNKIISILSAPLSGEIYKANEFELMNLDTEKNINVAAPEGDVLRILGFIGEDMIYGLAHSDDLIIDSTGNVFAPMYELRILDELGRLQKKYQKEGMYFSGIDIEENQISVKCVEIRDGVRKDAGYDTITANSDSIETQNKIAAVSIDVYQRYVQLKVKKEIDKNTLKIVYPKEEALEANQNIELEFTDNLTERFYAYNANGISGVYTNESYALQKAYADYGVVLDDDGREIYRRSSRSGRNQIMAITEDKAGDDRSVTAVCLDTVLKKEGIVRNAEYLLSHGENVISILESSLEDRTILDLTGCSLEIVLYYVTLDIPVMAMLTDGNSVLITGYNEYNIVVMDPKSGTLYKKGLGDSTAWFESNGNVFITYM